MQNQEAKSIRCKTRKSEAQSRKPPITSVFVSRPWSSHFNPHKITLMSLSLQLKTDNTYFNYE
jgi:hypothetical protein